MALYLGLDASTQSLTALVIEIAGDRRRVVFETSLNFDQAFPEYGTRHGVLPAMDPSVATSPPLMWARALDRIMGVVAANVDVQQIKAISGSAQQHGSVYLGAESAPALASLELEHAFTRESAPIWMDSSTAAECAEITRAVGGREVLAATTGSRAFERFTGPQIRRFFKRAPGAYTDTGRIHLVSSFHCSLLIGAQAPVDRGDASGMNLMDLQTGDWWPAALDAVAPGLAARLPRIVPSSAPAGTLSAYWRAKYGFPAAAVVTWSGDNPSSLIGLGLFREGPIAISLGTSDTVFGVMNVPQVDRGGTGHVFGAPTGAFMGLTCFQNGSLARERIRDDYGMSWPQFSRALDETPPGNNRRMMLPWFDPEITPLVPDSGVRRHDLQPDDAPANVRAVIEAQCLSMAIHSQWMGVKVEEIRATGGASANGAILQVIADVFGADVRRLEVSNSAALGAALRAAHADMSTATPAPGWADVVAGFTDASSSSPFRPRPEARAIYRAMMPRYSDFETRALRP